MLTMSKIYASMLHDEVSGLMEARESRVGGHALRVDHATLEHILTLKGIIEEARHRILLLCGFP